MPKKIPKEHREQLKTHYEIEKELANRLRDSSREEEVATGFHLKEYTTTELSYLFRKVGFSEIRVLRGKLMLPIFPVKCFETLLSKLPHLLRRKITGWSLVRWVLGSVQLVAKK